MPEPDARVKGLFVAALDLAGEQRDAFVTRECAGDDRLRLSLERLLRAHEEAGDFLDHPTGWIEAVASDLPPDELDEDLSVGDRVGPCELVERIAAGGFGSVWRARQLHPVQRDVAMKVLRRRGEVAAGELAAECQTLARMQHPGIASMFDAGVANGRPWLMMEFVDGEPITIYCTARQLSVTARLSLFVELCAALQHAHAKGFVHLDLKPHNVLVTERQGVPGPVVIDFGVARALSGDGDAAHGGVIAGTPEYMSPEQLGGEDALPDARSDVYSLGVLLRELVTGRRDGAADIGVSAELAWILRAATATDPGERYQAVTALADDVRRFLHHEPLSAGPDSLTYRARCFARRHRAFAAAVLLVMLALGGGVAVAMTGWWRASRAEQQARADQRRAEKASAQANRALDLIDELWSRADPSRLGSADYPASRLLADSLREVPARLGDDPAIELRVRRMMAGLQRFFGELDDAKVHADRAVQLARNVRDTSQLAFALARRAQIQVARGEVGAAEDDLTELERIAVTLGNGEGLSALVDTIRSDCLQRRGDTDAALAAAQRGLSARERIGDPVAIAQSLLRIASLQGAVGRIGPAFAAVERAIDLQAELGADHPDVITAVQHRAFLLQHRGDHEAAEAAFRDSLTRRLRVYGEGHYRVAWARAELAWLLHERARYGEAESLLRRAVSSLSDRLGDRHRLVHEARQRLGTVLMALGRLDEAEVELGAAIAGMQNARERDEAALANALGNLAGLHWQQGRLDEAVRGQRTALESARRHLPVDHFVVTVGMTNLAWMLERHGDPEEALHLLEEALRGSEGAGRANEARIQRERLGALRERLGR